MTNFISLIKGIPPEQIISSFSYQSIKMFKQHDYFCDIEVPVISNGYHRTLVAKLAAWDIHTIDYLSICNSNDYRTSNCPFSFGQVVALYRDYDNQHSIGKEIKNSDTDGVFRILTGMTAEQFQYQNLSWVSESFNRNYHILLGPSNFEHRAEINIDLVTESLFGYSANDYISILLIVFWLCMQHPDPLSAPETLYKKKNDTILTLENVQRFIEYYSCSYQELRESPLGKQLLYSKPFIKTDRQRRYISSSLYLVDMLMGNGLYWAVRDYYHCTAGQKFVNLFGQLFEDYIKELGSIYCCKGQWNALPEKSNEMSADFIFNLDLANAFVESKSSLLRLDAKQQTPITNSIDNFIKSNITKAYEQLLSSVKRYAFSQKDSKPNLKIILLYDDFSDQSLLQRSASEIFDKDGSCFIMTIREFEILLYLHKNDKATCEKVIRFLIDQSNQEPLQRKSIIFIYDELKLWKHTHFTGELNYFDKAMEKLERELKK